MRDELLGYYERELIFLRRMGAEFAQKYPKIAARLLLEEEKVEDPHVERMIEAFAFLSGRISLKLDDELPEISRGDEETLLPPADPIPINVTQPIPLESLTLEKTNGIAKTHATPIALTIASSPV